MTSGGPEALELEAGLQEVRACLGRRDYAGAREVGHRLVASYPTSAAAHAALGDVAAADHAYREAVEWYELAQRLEPSDSVRLRLVQAREALDAEEASEQEDALGREPRITLPLALGAGFLALCLIVTLVTVSVVHHRQAPGPAGSPVRSRPADRAVAAGPATTARPTPSRGVARPVPAGPRSAGYATPGASARREAAGPTVNQVVTEEVTGPMSDADLYLTRALSGLTWPTGTALGSRVQAWLDPFTGYAQITFEVPSGTPTGDLYGQTLDMAYRVAVGAVRSERGVESITVRALATVTGEDEKKTVQVAFRGNTNRETLDYYVKRNIQPDRDTLWKNVFATTWWNPSVPVQ